MKKAVKIDTMSGLKAKVIGFLAGAVEYVDRHATCYPKDSERCEQLQREIRLLVRKVLS